MKLIKFGMNGPEVQLLQLELNRAGFGPVDTDGNFGAITKNALIQFQQQKLLEPDGIVGTSTNEALLPYCMGCFSHVVKKGESIYAISRKYSAPLSGIIAANPGIDIKNLEIGTKIIVPLAFDVVPTRIEYSSKLIACCVKGLVLRFPFLKMGEIGKSVMGKPIWYLKYGNGSNTVIYNASHHANEWITTPLLLKFAEDISKAYLADGSIFGQSAREIFSKSSVYIVPAVNPDGIDLVTGEMNSGQYYDKALDIAAEFPLIPFPDGWKANIGGVDLNLQYPAGWEQAKENKFAKGFNKPAPADYVGSFPLVAPESRAMYDFTFLIDPALTISYHTQGEVIYWKYLNHEPHRAKSIAETFSDVSGYTVEDTPFESGFAGYKDWFIQQFDKPGFTIECGRGVNPLPISDFNKIYNDNLGILTLGTITTL